MLVDWLVKNYIPQAHIHIIFVLCVFSPLSAILCDHREGGRGPFPLYGSERFDSSYFLCQFPFFFLYRVPPPLRAEL